MMKRLLPVVGFVALAMSPPAQAEGLDDYRTIHVNASHQVKVAPDMAVVHFSVRTENDEVDVAKKEADTQLRAVKALLKEQDVDAKHLKTGHVSVQPRYSYHKGRDRKLEGYQVSYSLELKLKPMSSLGVILQKLTSVGITNINNVHYDLEHKDEARNKALVSALQKAHEKAAMLAKAEGEKLGSVLKIHEGQGGYHPRPMMGMRSAPMMMADAKTAENGELPPAGELDMSASVSVIYELDD